jgi:hypothetical protein
MMEVNPAGLAKVIAGALRPLYLRLQAVERIVGVAPQTSSLQPASPVKPRVRLKTWSADVQFAVDDAVVYGGKLYRATTNVIGMAPGDGAFAAALWQPIDDRRSGGAA